MNALWCNWETTQKYLLIFISKWRFNQLQCSLVKLTNFLLEISWILGPIKNNHYKKRKKKNSKTYVWLLILIFYLKLKQKKYYKKFQGIQRICSIGNFFFPFHFQSYFDDFWCSNFISLYSWVSYQNLYPVAISHYYFSIARNSLCIITQLILLLQKVGVWLEP